MTTQQLRYEILKGIDSVLDAPRFVQRFISDEAKRHLHAQRNYWEQADETQLSRALALYNAEPKRGDDSPKESLKDL